MGPKDDRQGQAEILKDVEVLIADALSKPKAKMPVGGGVYLIVNSANGFVYVGQTANFKLRMTGHKAALRGCRHTNTPMQRDWLQFGEDAFWFFPIWHLQSTKNVYLLAAERSVVEALGSDRCYNTMAIRVRTHDESGVKFKWHSFKMTPDEWAAFRELGGIDWLRAVIKRAKSPVKK